MASKQIKLKHVKEASTLYHYTKCNGVNGILENNCFWATKSDFLNDPKEFSYIEAIIRDICKELIKNEDWREMFLKDVLEEKVFLDGGRNNTLFPYTTLFRLSEERRVGKECIIFSSCRY